MSTETPTVEHAEPPAVPQTFLVPPWAHWLLFGGLLSVGIGRSVTLAVLAPIGRELGLMEIQVGLISALTAAMFFFGGPFWGRRCESMGRRQVMIIGLIGYAVTTVMFAAVVEAGLHGWLSILFVYPLMLLTRMAFAAVASGVFPASQSFIAVTTSPEERTSGIALQNAAFGLGSILGPAIGGAMVLISLIAPLYVAALVALVSATLIWMFLPEPPTRVTPPGVAKLRFTDPRIRPFLIINFFSSYVMATVHQVGGFYFQDVLHLTAAQTANRVGTALVLMAIVTMGAQFLIIRPFRLTPKVLLRFGAPTILVGVAVLIVSSTLIPLLVGMVLVGLGLGFSQPGNAAAGSLKVAPYEQGGLAGISMSAGSLGFGLGPLLGSALYQIKPEVPFVVALAMMIGVTAYVMWLSIPDPKDYRG
ncbi:MAG: MFS transporter [Alphaproteobacteria bacterium]|nr:MFS transporter [Alphaproteobacteria bacterium]